MVRPGGRIALLDVGVPHNPVIRWGNNIYFGKVVPEDRRAAQRRRRLPLPAQERRLPAAARAAWSPMLRAAGFADAEHHQLSGGLTQLMVGTRS